MLLGSNNLIIPADDDKFAHWADYANSTIDDLLALELRGASTLGNATLYGQTPTIRQEPGGGLNLTASGLVCVADTVLDSGKLASECDSAFVLVEGVDLGSNFNRVVGASGVGGQTDQSLAILPHYLGSNGAFLAGGSFLLSAHGGSNSGFWGISKNRIYFNQNGDDVTFGTIAEFNLYIGALNSGGSTDRKFRGTISAICIGTLKSGLSPDVVANQLFTRMAAAAPVQ